MKISIVCRLLILSSFIAGLVSVSFSQHRFSEPQDNFTGIIPFVTTRAEVEKKIGKPTQNSRYEFDDGRVYVFYRETKCEDSTNKTCLCLAPLGTVLTVEIEPYEDIFVKNLNLDPNLWIIADARDHVQGIENYSNPKSGVTYQVLDGKIRDITYRVSEETCKKLNEKLKPNRSGPSGQDQRGQRRTCGSAILKSAMK